REVIGAQPKRGQPDQQPGADRDRARCRQRQPEGPVRLQHQDRHRVRAHAHEPDLAEVDDAGEADVELEPEREDPVEAGEHADADPEFRLPEGAEADRGQGHMVRARPKMPCGRSTSVRIRAAKPTAIFQRASITSVDHSWISPSRKPPASAPYASPMPPRTTAANRLSNSRNPRSGVNVPTAEAYRTPARPARPPAKSQVATTIRLVSM